MAHLVRETRIAAPRDRVFDLARHVEAHVATMPDSHAEALRELVEGDDWRRYLTDERSERDTLARFGVVFLATAV